MVLLARMRLGRRGVSEAVTSVMLITVSLGTMVAAVFFAQRNLQMQAETTEFENGKASMLSLAQMIEGLIFSKGSSAYTRFTINSGGLSLAKGNEKLTVTVEGDTIFADTVNLIRLRGGAGVASPHYVVLKGVSGSSPDEHMRHLIVSPEDSAPLGWVYLKRESGVWVVTDFGRVRVVPSGAIRYTADGMNWTTVNTVEITCVRIVWGRFSGSGTFDVCAKVTGVTTTVRKYDSPSVTVTVGRGSYSKSYSIPSQAEDEATATLVFLTVVDVEISVV